MKLFWHLDLEAVRLFAKVCQLGSLKAVSQAENTSVSRISKKMKSLESALETELFQISLKEGVKPTTQGRKLIAYWQKMTESASEELFAESENKFSKIGMRPDDLKTLNLDFGLQHILFPRLLPDSPEIIQLPDPWCIFEGRQKLDVGVWMNTHAFPIMDQGTLADLGLVAFEFWVRSCVLVAHVSHPLSEEQEVDEFSLRSENIECIAGAEPCVSQHFDTGFFMKSASSAQSCLSRLSESPSSNILCLPASAAQVLYLYQNIKEINAVKALTFKKWTACHNLNSQSVRLAQAVAIFLSQGGGPSNSDEGGRGV